MAKLNKIVRANPVSNFRQVAPDGGAAFRGLADGLNSVYQELLPGAVDEMKSLGKEHGREIAKRQIGNSTPSGFGSGDDFDFSPFVVGGGTRPDAITGMSSGFRGGLAAMLAAAPDDIRADVKIGSGYRSDEVQAKLWQDALKKYGSPEKARKWVAPPGRSKHGSGQAADLRYGSDKTRKWFHDNAPSFGMHFPLSNEPWHIEEAGSRGGTHEPAIVRTSEGALEARRYSPYSGPALRAHNAAAGVAYQAEMMERGSVDLMQMSNEFLLDPDGFWQAGKEYVNSIVEGAPDHLKSDLRDVLEGEVTRRQMGIMEDKQKDTRARANNSSKALVDRWSNEYAEAIASGNAEEAEAVRVRLDSILQAREALPGVAWTEEQSANVFLKAQRDAESLVSGRATATSNGHKNQLKLIIKAAKNGRHAEDESILLDPSVQATNPELAREAEAHVALRDNLPEFLKMTPDEQAAALASMAEAGVREEWEVDILKAAQTAAKENRKAWGEDPIKHAGDVLSDENPPPPISDLSSGDEEKFIDALAKRREYGNDLVKDGYIKSPSYLSKEEAESIALAMGKGTPTEIRAAMAAAIVAGFGPDAVRVFEEIDGDDLAMIAGKRSALGGDAKTAEEMFRGQQMLDEGLVEMPKKSDRIEHFSAGVSAALSGVPNELAARKEIMIGATAIYAARAQGIDPKSDAAKILMEESIQSVLGQTKSKNGDILGGSQEVMGHSVLLPMGVSGKDADLAVSMAMGGTRNGGGFFGGLSNLGAALSGNEVYTGLDVDAWEKAAVHGGTPMFNGKPIPENYVESGAIKLVPAGGNLYRMELVSGSGTAANVTDGNGDVFFFDLQKLMEANE